MMAALAFLSPVGAFLKRIPWQLYVAIAIASAFGLLLHNRNHWKAVATERQASLVTLHATLDSISTKRNEQAKISTITVTKVVHDQDKIRTVVQHIHDAPNPPDCGTPALPELRNEL